MKYLCALLPVGIAGDQWIAGGPMTFGALAADGLQLFILLCVVAILYFGTASIALLCLETIQGRKLK